MFVLFVYVTDCLCFLKFLDLGKNNDNKNKGNLTNYVDIL